MEATEVLLRNATTVLLDLTNRSRLHIRSVEVLCYCLVYDHFRLTTFPWDSAGTWLFCAILVDWGFYWAHRLAHEINFIWAIHQGHHNGQDFTFIASIRQALLQPFTAWISYTPLALIGIPPQVFLTHIQLTEMYMIWIHTETVDSLGPLEYIINTPKHHRVHHGRNRKYIDKNYAGALIIWDKMFGTFEPEDPEEPAIFGLVHPVESYNIFWLQFHSWAAMFQNIYHTKGWRNKLLIPFMGPGWAPGKPRLGYIDEIPELNHPVPYWEPPTSFLAKAYCVWHFFVIFLFYEQVSVRNAEFSQWTLLTCTSAILLSMTSIGIILECRSYAAQVELLRCLAFFLVEQYLTPLRDMSHGYFEGVDNSLRDLVIVGIRLTFLLSAIICAICEFRRMSLKALDYIKSEIKKHKVL
ncbi:hypothetical protein TYRP_010156 [Tyrophagus putrescentiae]|nr:hypothetical protein TYRP_010156 [Tyrophagus putrescentiae]